MIFMRGWVGEIVFIFDKRGKVLGLMLWREWEANHTGKWLEPGQEIEL